MAIFRLPTGSTYYAAIWGFDGTRWNGSAMVATNAIANIDWETGMVPLVSLSTSSSSATGVFTFAAPALPAGFYFLTIHTINTFEPAANAIASMKFAWNGLAEVQELPAAAAGASGGVSILDANLTVGANLKAILGTLLTETAGYLAAGFKKFFNVGSPTGTLNSLPGATPGVAGGVPVTLSNGLVAADVRNVFAHMVGDPGIGNTVYFPTLPYGYAGGPPLTDGDGKVSATVAIGEIDASDFTGAFSASVLANAPRTGMVLSASSLARGPEASLADEDIQATVFKGGSPRLCAMVYLNGTAITQADVSTITYTIYELGSRPDDRTAITGHMDVSLSAADVIYDSLQTDAQASKFNYAHQVPVSVHPAYATAGKSYQVEYKVQPTSGQVIIVRFQVSCI